MKDELADYATVLEHCTHIYSHFTDGRISKANTLPEEVIQVAEELENERTEEACREAVAEARSENLTDPGEMECRYCGCTEGDGCPGGCHWVGDGVCSHCQERLDYVAAVVLARSARIDIEKEIRPADITYVWAESLLRARRERLEKAGPA